MNIILSYPRSGNHLTRFFIELLSEQPTFGCFYNQEDIPIYLNRFNNEIPFNINNNYNEKVCYHKYHNPPENIDCSNLIFILRNPQEVLLRHCNYRINLQSFNDYFADIDYYLNFTGNKILFFYEDIVLNKIDFVNKLYDFLECKNNKKLEWVINNIDYLYDESKNGKNRSWGGVNSNNINYYYPKIINKVVKYKFDKYLYEKLSNPNYSFILDKYNIL